MTERYLVANHPTGPITKVEEYNPETGEMRTIENFRKYVRHGKTYVAFEPEEK